MVRSSKFLYTVLALGCFAGYAWLVFVCFYPQTDTTVCLVKNVTGLPCPSCGSTRAIAAIVNGDLRGVIHFNPIGVILFLVLMISPWWLGYDLITGRRTLATWFNRAERQFQRAGIAIPAIVLLILNWLWTYSKGL